MKPNAQRGEDYMQREIMRCVEDMLPFRNVFVNFMPSYTCANFYIRFVFDNHFTCIAKFTYIVHLISEVNDRQ